MITNHSRSFYRQWLSLLPHTYNRRPITGLVLVFCVIISACGAPKVPLEQIHADSARNNKIPVIVIPGIGGSRLVDSLTGEEYWPGSLYALITGRYFNRLALPVHPDQQQSTLSVGELTYDGIGQEFYKDLLDTLTGPGQYNCVASEKFTQQHSCAVMYWDWRDDLVIAAQKLHNTIDQIRREYNNPDQRVDIVAHSGGGMVARYFMRFGNKDVLDLPSEDVELNMEGAAKVRKLIMIGVPNYGSITGLQNAIQGFPIAYRKLRPAITATMTGLFQLLPHPDRTWMIDIEGDRVDVDLYDKDVIKSFNWSVYEPAVRKHLGELYRRTKHPTFTLDEFVAASEQHFEKNLARAYNFHKALSIPVTSSPTKYIILGGDCHFTPDTCLLEEVDGKYQVRLHPDEINNPLPDVDYDRLMLAPGDGTVTKLSLLARDTFARDVSEQGFFPIDQIVFVCDRHNRLPGNFTFRNNILNALLF